jgi:hypothetical protein
VAYPALQIEPFAQDDAAFLGGFTTPCRPRCIGSVNRQLGIIGTQIGHFCQYFTGSRVGHREARFTRSPLAVDESIGFENGWVIEQGKRRVHEVIAGFGVIQAYRFGWTDGELAWPIAGRIF